LFVLHQTKQIGSIGIVFELEELDFGLELDDLGAQLGPLTRLILRLLAVRLRLRDSHHA
jgi:hypothetical protein